MSTGSQPQPFDLTRLKRKWAIRSPAELKDRSRELGGSRFVIDSLLPTRSIALVVGDSGLGKSPLWYQAALCVASGTPFLGHPVEKGRVLYLDYENGIGHSDELIERIVKHLDLPRLPDELLFWHQIDASPKWGREGHTALEMIRDVSPSLVIIDSLSSFNPEMEEKNPTAARVYQSFREIIRDCSTTFVCIHHIKKPSDKSEYAPEPLESANLRQWFLQARGARALFNLSDVRIGLDQPHTSALNYSGNNTEELALVMRGLGRVRGEIPIAYIARQLDEEGEPLGYTKLTGAALLFNQDQIAAWKKLPCQFRFKDAQRIYDKGPQATTDWLSKCRNVGIVRKLGRAYEKVDDCEMQVSPRPKSAEQPE